MTTPRPSLGRVYVLNASGIWQAFLIDPAAPHGRGTGTRIRVRGAPRPVTVDSRLIFTDRAPAVELRTKAMALARTPAWCHRTIPQIAIHLLTGGRAP